MKPEIIYYCAVKNRLSGSWDWITQNTTAEGHHAPWSAGKMKGFTRDGKLMIFLYGHELEELDGNTKALITNPKEIERIDPEMDMFILLCDLKK